MARSRSVLISERISYAHAKIAQYRTLRSTTSTKSGSITGVIIERTKIVDRDGPKIADNCEWRFINLWRDV